MPPDILLYAIIAAGLIFWLKSILGTDADDNPSSSNDDQVPSFLKDTKKESNVVPLNSEVGMGFTLPRYVRIDNKTTENALEDINKKYDRFDLNQFVSGAEYAFPMIIEAFAEGDRDTLENLLEPQVFKAFDNAISEREKRGETVITEVKSVEKIDIQEAYVKDDKFYLTTRFVAKEICVIKDKEGAVISGDPDQQTEMNDIWVFTKNVDSDGPEWHLFETRDGDVEEDHKTPLPDSHKD